MQLFNEKSEGSLWGLIHLTRVAADPLITKKRQIELRGVSHEAGNHSKVAISLTLFHLTHSVT